MVLLQSAYKPSQEGPFRLQLDDDVTPLDHLHVSHFSELPSNWHLAPQRDESAMILTTHTVLTRQVVFCTFRWRGISVPGSIQQSLQTAYLESKGQLLGSWWRYQQADFLLHRPVGQVSVSGITLGTIRRSLVTSPLMGRTQMQSPPGASHDLMCGFLWWLTSLPSRSPQ